MQKAWSPEMETERDTLTASVSDFLINYFFYYYFKYVANVTFAKSGDNPVQTG